MNFKFKKSQKYSDSSMPYKSGSDFVVQSELYPNSTIKSKKDKVLDFTKGISKRWFIEAFTGMAQGLFVTLIAGTIIKQIGLLMKDTKFGKFLILIGYIASILMGAGIGGGIASYLKCSRLVIFSAMVAGIIGAYSTEFIANANLADIMTKMSKGIPGNPIGAYVVSLMAIEFSRLVAGKTKVDLLVVPLFMFMVSLLGAYCAVPAIKFIDLIALGIEKTTTAQPFIMGILISVSVGILLTMPTSSAAIWVAIAAGKTSDAMLLAGGAAVVGCASQMVGFAILSYKENGFGGLISQGLGTSMLQIPNIMRHPTIFLPPIIASAIVGPLATTVFKLKCNAVGGGMGTSGLVGVFGVIDASSAQEPWIYSLGIILLMFVLPAIICAVLGCLFRKKGWIKGEYLKLEYNK